MKMRREHRVPLCARAVAILESLKQRGERLFPITHAAMRLQLRRMGIEDFTVHGFRSTFRDWAAERTNYPNHVVEMALGHAVGDKVEAAYRRGDLFEKRRLLMDAWAEYCEHGATAGEVVALRA
jgi:integrase